MTEKTDTARFKYRPHHFMCAVGYRGHGYSPKFVENYDKIMDVLRAEGGDEVRIKVVAQTDDICGPCPHRREQLCAQQEKIDSLDQRHAAVLGVSSGEVLTWGQAKERIRSKVTLDVFHEMCKGCQWQPLGICQQALADLKREI